MAATGLQADPTKTTTLRRAFMADVRQRFRALRGAHNALLVDEDAFGLIDRRPVGVPTLVGNVRWAFMDDPGKLDAYKAWLKSQTEAGILGNRGDPEPWTNRYIESSYKKAVSRSYDDVRQVAGTGATGAEKAAAKAEFLRNSFATPAAEARVRLLYTRAYSQLQGITAAMDQELSRTMAAGLANGTGPRELARTINKQIDGIEKKRALTMARTETIHAYAEGQLDSMEALGVGAVAANVEWQTAGDAKVCPLCKPLQGIILTTQEARGMIPRHPNCRCAWVPAIVGEDTEGQVYAKDEINARIRESLKKEKPKLSATEARKASRWVGADAKPSHKSGQKLTKAKRAEINKKIAKLKRDAKAAALADQAKADAAAAARAKAAEQAAQAAEQAKVQAAAAELAAKMAAAKAAADAVAKKAAKQAADAAAAKAAADKAKALAQTKTYMEVDEVLPSNMQPDLTDGFTKPGMVDHAKFHYGVDLDKPQYNDNLADILGLVDDIEPPKSVLPAQLGQLDNLVLEDLEEVTKKAQLGQLLADATDDVDGLDLVDYATAEVGWTKPPKGKTQSYGMLLFNDEGKVLMRKSKDNFGGAGWTFPKGGGSKPASTALAELAEETGHKAEFTGIVPGNFKGTTTQTNYFIGKSKGVDVSLMDAESEAVEWVSIDQAISKIKEHSSKQVVARDLAVLHKGYAAADDTTGAWASVLAAKDEAKAAADAVAKAEAAAVQSNKIKIGAAKSHYAKDKFGGGVQVNTADYADPGPKSKKQFNTKLAPQGLNKVLSEKGWHLDSLPPAQAARLVDAPDLAAQKAAIDKLKKAPKGTAIPKAAVPDGDAAAALVSVDDFDLVADVTNGDIDADYLYKKLDAANHAGKLTSDDYDAAIDAVWLGDTVDEQKATLAQLLGDYVKENGPVAARRTKGPPVVKLDWGPDDTVDMANLKPSYVKAKLKEANYAGKYSDDILDDTLGNVMLFDDIEDQTDYLAETLANIVEDNLKAAPAAARAATTTADAVADATKRAYAATTLELPDPTNLTKIKDLPGSTRPYLAKDGSGKLWVVKSTDTIDPAHLRSEGLADDLYRRAGLRVPKGGIVQQDSGPVKVTEYLEDGMTLADWRTGKTKAQIDAMHKQIQKGFVADALFANHDVVGLSSDNIFVVAGKAYRIDNGGALAYRAQGAAKRGWGGKVLELGSMRDRNVNPQTAAVFGGITDGEIHDQIRDLLTRRQAILDAIDDQAQRAIVAARLDDLATKLPPDTSKVRQVAGATRAEYGIGDNTAKRVQASRVNGTTVAADRGDIEDNNVLIWQEENTAGKQVTRMQFKVTQEGSRKLEAALGEELAKAAPPAARAVSNVHPKDTHWQSILSGIKTVAVHAKDGQYNASTLAQLGNTHTKIKDAIAAGAKSDELAMLTRYDKVIEATLEAKEKGAVPPAAVQYQVKPKKPKTPTAPPRRSPWRVARTPGIEYRTTSFKNGRARQGAAVNKFRTSEAYDIKAEDGTSVQFVPNRGLDNSRGGLAMHGTVTVEVGEDVSSASLQKAMQVVEDLGIDTTPPSAAYEELVYLRRSIHIRKDTDDPGFAKIWDDVSLTDEDKVDQLKDWASKRYKVDLKNPKYYDPHGVAKTSFGDGVRHWYRWDLPPSEIEAKMADYTIYHTTGGLGQSGKGAIPGLVDKLLQSGGEFTTTTGRIRKGVSVSATGGASSSADMDTGGASYFFTRIKKEDKAAKVAGFFFKRSRLARQDVISYGSDNFGSVSRLQERASDVAGLKKHAGNSGNEAIFKEGLSVLDDIDYIRVFDEKERADLLAAFKRNGVTELPDGRAVKDIVVKIGEMPSAAGRAKNEF